jgi:hypothetical protein
MTELVKLASLKPPSLEDSLRHINLVPSQRGLMTIHIPVSQNWALELPACQPDWLVFWPWRLPLCGELSAEMLVMEKAQPRMFSAMAIICFSTGREKPFLWSRLGLFRSP